MNDLVLLIARVLLVLLFIISGAGMAAGASGVAGWFGAIGIPAPSLVVWLVVLLKLGAGLAILTGWQTRYAAYGLAAFCLATALIAHTNFADQNELNSFFKNLAIAGGFLALSVVGPGAYSVGARRA